MPIPYTNIEKIKEVMSYRKKDEETSFRKIAELMNSNVKTIYRWYLQGIGKEKIRIRIKV